jgi:uncharacterized protein (DUF2384 family)
MSWTIDLGKLPVRKLGGLASMRPRLARLTEVLGVRPVAALLGTDASNLSKALAGKRDLSPEIARRALDLDHVLARALQIMEPQVVIDWLEGSEPTFGFARPIDVLALRGSAPVLDVLDRLEAGAYA